MPRETIFVIDDNPANLGLLFDHLKLAGYRVLLDTNGESALSVIREIQPDVILLDVIMPGLDGFETCRRLKADESTCDIPVIFMTALSEVVDEVQGLELGAVDYIVKPFQAESVLARLKTHLVLRSLQKALQEKNVELGRVNGELTCEIAERERVQAELQQAQNELAKYAGHLEQLVEVQVRELELERAKLIHSEKMAALGRLVASIAHEINNPLQAMQGCVDLTLEELAGKRRPEKLNRHLGIIKAEIMRISAIVQRMRDFYRPANEGLGPTDLYEVLESVFALTQKQLQQSDIVVEREWGKDVPLIQANADRLKQVF